jgi:hypothetical protein
MATARAPAPLFKKDNPVLAGFSLALVLCVKIIIAKNIDSFLIMLIPFQKRLRLRLRKIIQGDEQLKLNGSPKKRHSEFSL